MEFVASPPKYLQISEILREQITSGNMRPGERLHSIRNLSRELSVSKKIVESAFNVLAKDKLIVKRPGRLGTYVAKPDSSKIVHKQIALIHEINPEVLPEHVFYSSLFNCLGTTANFNDYDFRVYNSSLEQQTTHSLIKNRNAALRRILQSKEVTGLMLLVQFSEPLILELTELNLPYVAIASKYRNTPNQVDYDICKAKAMALEYLMDRGCMRIGVVFPSRNNIPNRRVFFEELGVAPEIAENDKTVSFFHNLDEAMEKSDGLVITDDYYALHHSIALAKFKPTKNIVVLANAGMRFPLPFTRVDYSPLKLAESAWDMLSKQIDSGVFNQKTILIQPELKEERNENE